MSFEFEIPDVVQIDGVDGSPHPRPMQMGSEKDRASEVTKTAGEPMTKFQGNSNPYIDYESVDLLLSLQHPRSSGYDEMCFIIMGQAKELMFKAAYYELHNARLRIQDDDLPNAIVLLDRSKKIVKHIVGFWDVLSTISADGFNQFRDYLDVASGQQSFMYRHVEFVLGNKSIRMCDTHRNVPHVYPAIKDNLDSPSLYDEVIRLLARNGHEISTQCLKRDWAETYTPHQSIESAWLEIYKDPGPHNPLYGLGESLIELADLVSQYRWRHFVTVERILGFKPGTGGSSGVGWLRNIVDHRFFSGTLVNSKRTMNSYISLYEEHKLKRAAYWIFVVLTSHCLVACGTPVEETSDNEQSSSLGTKQPNILFIVADDLGYTDLGAYGSEIETPNLDNLARNGVLFSNFYVAPTCSPTRAMLLSGVDNHPAGMGSMYREIAPNQAGKPGYEEELNTRVATIAELLTDAGFHTYMTGKWHLGYETDNSPAARGFERSFASLAGGAGHLDMLPIVGPGKAPYREDQNIVDELPEDFYSSRFFTRKLIEYIESNRGDNRPFFGYLAYTAVHWPLQAPAASIEKFKGRYDNGYDDLHERRVTRLKELGLIAEDIESFPRLTEERPWDELTSEQQRREARLMEVYAAMVSDIDVYVGELITYLKSIDEFDNTFIVFMSDNGAEGHPVGTSIGAVSRWVDACCDNSIDNMGNRDSFLWTGANWARASVGPWRMFKGFTSEGGIRAPAFVHYPELGGGNVNQELLTVLDVLPTVLELTGIRHPGTRYKDRDISPLMGKSMLPVLRGEAETVHSADDAIGWELFGKTAIRQGNWKIIQEPGGDFWSARNPLEENYAWQLFNLAEDPSELHDLAAENPQKLQEMIVLWNQYAKDNRVIIPNQVMGY